MTQIISLQEARERGNYKFKIAPTLRCKQNYYNLKLAYKFYSQFFEFMAQLTNDMINFIRMQDKQAFQVTHWYSARV